MTNRSFEYEWIVRQNISEALADIARGLESLGTAEQATFSQLHSSFQRVKLDTSQLDTSMEHLSKRLADVQRIENETSRNLANMTRTRAAAQKQLEAATTGGDTAGIKQSQREVNKLDADLDKARARRKSQLAEATRDFEALGVNIRKNGIFLRPVEEIWDAIISKAKQARIAQQQALENAPRGSTESKNAASENRNLTNTVNRLLGKEGAGLVDANGGASIKAYQEMSRGVQAAIKKNAAETLAAERTAAAQIAQDDALDQAWRRVAQKGLRALQERQAQEDAANAQFLQHRIVKRREEAAKEAEAEARASQIVITSIEREEARQRQAREASQPFNNGGTRMNIGTPNPAAPDVATGSGAAPTLMRRLADEAAAVSAPVNRAHAEVDSFMKDITLKAPRVAQEFTAFSHDIDLISQSLNRMAHGEQDAFGVMLQSLRSVNVATTQITQGSSSITRYMAQQEAAAENLSKRLAELAIKYEQLDKSQPTTQRGQDNRDAGLDRILRQMEDLQRVSDKSNIFDKLGIQWRTAAGELKPVEQVMAQVILKLREMPESAERAAMAQKVLGASGAGLVTQTGAVYTALQRYDNELEKNARATEQASSLWGKFYDRIKNQAVGFLIYRGLDTALQAITQLSGQLIAAPARAEQALITYTHALGSVTEAKQRLADITDEALFAPQTREDLIAMDQQLQFFGLYSAAVKRFGRDAKQIRTDILDASAFANVEAEQIAEILVQMAGGEEGIALQRMRRLRLASNAELKALGIEFSKDGREILSSADETTSALLQLWENKFGGMAAVQATSFNGMMAQIGDFGEKALTALGQGLFDVVAEDARTMFDNLNRPEVMAEIQEWGKGIGVAARFASDLAGAFGTVLGVLAPIGSIIGDLVKQIGYMSGAYDSAGNKILSNEDKILAAIEARSNASNKAATDAAEAEQRLQDAATTRYNKWLEELKGQTEKRTKSLQSNVDDERDAWKSRERGFDAEIEGYRRVQEAMQRRYDAENANAEVFDLEADIKKKEKLAGDVFSSIGQSAAEALPGLYSQLAKKRREIAFNADKDANSDAMQLKQDEKERAQLEYEGRVEALNEMIEGIKAAYDRAAEDSDGFIKTMADSMRAADQYASYDVTAPVIPPVAPPVVDPLASQKAADQGFQFDWETWITKGIENMKLMFDGHKLRDEDNINKWVLKWMGIDPDLNGAALDKAIGDWLVERAKNGLQNMMDFWRKPVPDSQNMNKIILHALGFSDADINSPITVFFQKIEDLTIKGIINFMRLIGANDLADKMQKQNPRAFGLEPYSDGTYQPDAGKGGFAPGTEGSNVNPKWGGGFGGGPQTTNGLTPEQQGALNSLNGVAGGVSGYGKGYTPPAAAAPGPNTTGKPETWPSTSEYYIDSYNNLGQPVWKRNPYYSAGGVPGRAFGGPVMANQPYEVHPPEIFIPRTSGYISPMRANGEASYAGAGGAQTIRVVNSNLCANCRKEEFVEHTHEFRGHIAQEVANEIRGVH